MKMIGKNETEGCLDVGGGVVGSGKEFIPGPDKCTTCLCEDGQPTFCQPIKCNPPSYNCTAHRLGVLNGSSGSNNSCCDFLCLNLNDQKSAAVSYLTEVDGNIVDVMDPNKPLWDDNFTPPEYLYKIILVCMFFGFILFLIFFALVRYLKFQNKAMAILRAQQEREAALFPQGFDGLLCPDTDFEGTAGGEVPLVSQTEEGADNVKQCTCNPQGEDACVCQPLNPTNLPLQQV